MLPFNLNVIQYFHWLSVFLTTMLVSFNSSLSDFCQDDTSLFRVACVDVTVLLDQYMTHSKTIKLYNYKNKDITTYDITAWTMCHHQWVLTVVAMFHCLKCIFYFLFFFFFVLKELCQGTHVSAETVLVTKMKR